MRKRIESLVVKSLIPLIRNLPLSTARSLGESLGFILRDLLRIRRTVVESNIRRAFPDMSDSEVQGITRDVYRFFSRAAIDWFRLDEVRSNENIDLVDWHHAERLKESGGIIVSAHLGYWEFAAAELANQFGGFTVYVDRQSNPETEKIIDELRSSHSVRTVSGSSGLRKLVRLVEEGKVVGILGDQRPRNQHEYVKFFHDTVKNTRILSFVARHTQKIVVPIAMVRTGKESIELRSYPPLETSKNQVTKSNRKQLLREYNQWLEERIREFPEQYFWAHKRWQGAK